MMNPEKHLPGCLEQPGRSIDPESPRDSIRPAFRYFLIGTAFLIFSLILMGVIARVEESGQYCLDWSLPCFGVGLVEPGSPAFIPFVHGILAGLAMVNILIANAFAWKAYRHQTWLKLPLAIGAGLMLVQISLGRLMVDPEAVPGLTAIHFALALSTLAVILIPVVSSTARVPPDGDKKRSDQPILSLFTSPFGKLSVVTTIFILVLLVSGTWVAAVGGQSTCQSWPLCGESIVPTDWTSLINFMHRIFSLVSGILMVALFIQAWRSQRHRTPILVATTAAAVLFACQSLMGIVETTRAFPPYLIGLHAATAIAVWTAMVVQITLVSQVKMVVGGDAIDIESGKSRPIGRLVRDYLMLTKPVVVGLLLVTTFVGMVLGGQAWPPLETTLWTLLAGFLAAGGSGAINQYIDRFDDGKMQRTSGRPIPSGRLTPGEGLAFGIAAVIAAFYLMVAMVNFLAALLTLAGTIYYVILYSLILKKTTVQNIVIGGGAGAIPPLVGWAAVTGSLNIPSLFLFAVVFMWTPPHFWALALVRKVDYARAGVPMLPVVRGERETRWQIFLYTMELVGLTLVLPVFGLGGGIYFISAALLGGFLLYSAWNVWRGVGNKVAWKMYRHSSMYLAFLFLALMVDALF